MDNFSNTGNRIPSGGGTVTAGGNEPRLAPSGDMGVPAGGPFLPPDARRADSSVAFNTLPSPTVSLDRNPVPKYERLQMTISNSKTYTNPFNPDEIDVHGDFTSPSGVKRSICGFWNGSSFQLRFAGSETGLWSYVVSMTDSEGTSSQTGTFNVVESAHHGWLRVSPRDAHYIQHDDGTPFYGVGFCRPWSVDPGMFATMKTNGCNIFVYWMATWNHPLFNMATGYDRYDMADAAAIDAILETAEANDVGMALTVWYHGRLRDASHSWGGEEWSGNPFNALSACPAFFTDPTSWNYQKKLYRYIIARWGYSRCLAMWHTISEINGTCAHDNADSWHRKINDYFAQNDPFRHLMSGSMGHVGAWPGGFSVMDCLQVHSYAGDQSAAGIAGNVARVTEGLFRDYPKPSFHGEFGLTTSNGEDNRTAYQHNGAWAGLASGAAINPLMWNDGGDWGNQTAAMYEQMRCFRAFVDTLDMASEAFEKADVSTTLGDGNVWGLKGSGNSIFWLQDRSPGETVSGAVVIFSGLAAGRYRIRPYGCWTGAWHSPREVTHAGGDLALTMPDFQKDIAVRIEKIDIAPRRRA